MYCCERECHCTYLSRGTTQLARKLAARPLVVGEGKEKVGSLRRAVAQSNEISAGPCCSVLAAWGGVLGRFVRPAEGQEPAALAVEDGLPARTGNGGGLELGFVKP